MCEKKLRDPQQIIHLEYLGAHFVVYPLCLRNGGLLDTEKPSYERPGASPTHIVEHLVSGQLTDLLQVLKNDNRDETSTEKF